MTREQLDALLRRENLFEQNPDMEVNPERFDAFAAMAGGRQLTPAEYGAAVLRAVNMADGVVVSKQDRYREVPPHTHDWLELAYMYAGEATITVAGTEVPLRKGDCLLINYNARHSCSCCGREDILVNFLVNRKYLNANFFNRFTESSFLSRFLMDNLADESNRRGFICFRAADSGRLERFTEEFLCEYYDRSGHSIDFLNSLTTLIFLELANIYREDTGERPGRNETLRILKYIEENYAACSLKSTAEYFHMNPNYLSAYIREHTGRTYKALVQEQRMNLAAKLLKNTELPVTAVAAQAGYDNVTFFYKKFRESRGCSPAEYRERQGENAGA